MKGKITFVVIQQTNFEKPPGYVFLWFRINIKRTYKFYNTQFFKILVLNLINLIMIFFVLLH